MPKTEQEVLFGTEAPVFASYDVELRFIDDARELPNVEQSFVDSIRDTGGPLLPVLLRRYDPGTDGLARYTTIEGRRRLHACLVLGLRKCPARILTSDGWGNDAVLTFIANEKRSGNEVVALDKLEELVRDGWSIEKIAAYARVKPRVINRYLALAALTPALRKAWQEGRLGSDVARRAAKMTREQQVALFQFFATTKRTAGEIRAQITVLTRPSEAASLFAKEEVILQYQHDVEVLRQLGERWGALASDAVQPVVQRLATERDLRLHRIDQEQHRPADPGLGGADPEGQGGDVVVPAEQRPQPVPVGGGPTEIVETYDKDDVPL